MKSFFLMCVQFLIISAYAQTTTIALQSFESSGDNWQPVQFSTPPCTNGNDTWNYQSSLLAITANTGSQFWGIRDLNGNCGGNGFESISLPNVDISNFRNIILSFDFNVFEFDNGDDIKYELFFNDIAQGEIILFEGISNLSTNNWESEIINIPNTVTNIRINILIKQNGDNDYAGIDNVKIQGEPLINCSELMISEYIEGNSSTNYRNNYIELYNPTGSSVDLESYNLEKYTNKSIVVSNTLHLTGTIPAFGTFLIEDSTEILGVNANFSTNSAVMDYNGDDKIALSKSSEIIDLIGVIGVIGDSVNFAKDISLRRKSNVQNPNNQYDLNEWDNYDLDNISNINSHVSICSGPIPEIEVLGNYIHISDGNVITSVINNTYFGSIDENSGTEIVNSFTIKNIGNADLNLVDITISGTNASDFYILVSPVLNIQPLDSTLISIRFKPASLGLKTASIHIENNDASENLYSFVVQGEGTGLSNSPLLITQYYEGSGNNKWIEVKNTGSTATPDNTYFLALFWNEDAKGPVGIKPSRQKVIPALLPGQTIKYCSTLNVSLPGYAIDGNEIKSTVCSFTGDDIIILSTTKSESCWEDRIDMIGNSTSWGKDKSLVRKYGCKHVEAKTGYDPNDWFVYNISEIDSAKVGINLRIGEHFIGPTTFEANKSWNNGIPDVYREALINTDYATLQNSDLEVCNLIINSGKILSIGSNSYVSVVNDLTVNGSLVVDNKGSLLMVNNNGNVINNGDIKIHKSTPILKKQDYTYWSSPVKNAILESIFSSSPQNSFYNFETRNYNDANNDDLDDDENAWQRISGQMNSGIGYTAMAPNNEPFENVQSVIFSGEINNGIINVPIYLSENDSNNLDDWNLIGNPYPSAISANLFLEANKDLINGSLYFWTHRTAVSSNNIYNSDDYAIYTMGTGGIAAVPNGQIPTGVIASGQGFFTEAIQEGIIEFNNEFRVKSGNDNFFKAQNTKSETEIEEDKIWINLYNDKGGFSQILIGFIEGANEIYEFQYDGIRLKSSNFLSFYSIVGNNQLAIQGTNSFKGDESILLGYSTIIEEEINLKIKIDHLEGDLKYQDIFLIDNLLRITHDLKKSEYSFVSNNTGDFKNRFYLKFNNTVLELDDSKQSSESLIIQNRNTNFLIKTLNNKIISGITIYDILGRKISNFNVYNDFLIIDKNSISSGAIYIVRAELENGLILTNKFIR